MREHSAAACLHLVRQRGRARRRRPRRHTHAQLLALDFVPALIARERERFGAYANADDGASSCSTTWSRRRFAAASGSSRSTTRRCCSRPSPRALPYQLMLVPAPAAAALRGRRPDRRRAAARRARPARPPLRRGPPLNLWVRTAPRGAEHFCWRIDIVPRLAGARRARARQRRPPQQRRAGASGGGAARRHEGAGAARRSRAGRARRAARRWRRSDPGLLVLLGVAHSDDRDCADRLAEKIRALRIFADADGRMNEPLGDREVSASASSRSTPTRAAEPAELRAARAEPERARSALRALLRASSGRRAGRFGAQMEVELDRTTGR